MAVDFQALATRMDDAVFARLTDAATLDDEPVAGAFQAPWTQPRLGALRTEVIEPTLLLRDAPAAPAQLGSIVTHAGRTYEVVGIEPDGTGVTSLVLREVHA